MSRLGADLVLERSPADWLAALQTAVPQGMNVVLDVIGGEESDRNLRALASQGTVMQVGLMGGASSSVTTGLILAKRATWIGTTLRNRPIEQKCWPFRASLPRCCRGSTPVICDL